MNTLKFAIVSSLILLAAGLIADHVVNGQELGPLRYKPSIAEDEIIFCIKDVKNEQYKNQVSCYIDTADHILNSTQIKEIYQKGYSLNDTFEMGLID